MHFQYAHFNLPIYRSPISSLVTIFVPLFILAIINLVIFFQSNNLADRVSSTSTVMIAQVALIPVIRSQIPPHPKINFIELLVYIQSLTNLLVLLDSWLIIDKVSYKFTWYTDGVYWVSVILTIFVFLAIILATLYYFLIKIKRKRFTRTEKK